MDGLLIIIGVTFLGLIAVSIFFFVRQEKEEETKTVKEKNQSKIPPVELTPQLQNKIFLSEEKIKKLEDSIQTLQTELQQAQEREKILREEKSQMVLDNQQYEKLKKEYVFLQEEAKKTEETLEKEITARRQENSELIQLRQDYQTLRQENTETNDAYRRAQTTLEALTQELNSLRNQWEEQTKIIQEHAQNKTEGKWILRSEFEKIEKILKEKEAFIQKILSQRTSAEPQEKTS